MREGTEEAPWSLREVALGLALGLGATLFLTAGVALSSLRGGVRTPLVLAFSALQEGALLGVVWLLLVRGRRLSWAQVGFRAIAWPGPPLLGALLSLLTVGAIIGATSAYEAVVRALGLASLAPPVVPEALRPEGPLRAPAVALVVAAGPVAEEAFFRGLVLQGLVPRLGRGWALFLSSAAFGLWHGHPGLMVPTFVAGLLLGAVTLATRSLWPAVGAHMLENALAYTLGG